MHNAITGVLIFSGAVLATLSARHLPAHWEWENSPVEWSQVVLLALGMLLCLARARAAQRTQDVRLYRLWLLSAPGWAILFGREVSWGRVFFVFGYGDTGPVFVPMSEVRHGGAYTVLICVFIALWLAVSIRFGVPGSVLWLARQKRIPIAGSAAVFAVCIYWRYAAETLKYPMLEELLETVAYAGMLAVAAGVKNAVSGQDVTRKKTRPKRT